MSDKNSENAKLTINNEDLDYNVDKGSIGPDVIDISKLYSETGKFTYDPGFTSTASCKSTITYIDGEEGVLLYRGYPIEQLAEKGNYLETCYLLLNGELPNQSQYNEFDEIIVSASRKAEKLQEAPAAVSVISARQLSQSGGSISPLRALINTPGVDLQQQTGQRINIALRGGSSVFSTNVFPLLDYRSLISPGLEYFDSQNSPLNTIDLERIEVVLGPGSALYGPDVTTGVIHFISKDPFKYAGTTTELVYGERNTFKAAMRHAGHNKKETFGIIKVLFHQPDPLGHIKKNRKH